MQSESGDELYFLCSLPKVDWLCVVSLALYAWHAPLASQLSERRTRADVNHRLQWTFVHTSQVLAIISILFYLRPLVHIGVFCTNYCHFKYIY